MIALTFDVDWVPDEVLADTLALLNRAGVSATIFATHETPLLTENPQHEVALHPDFRRGDCERALDELQAVYPAARGVRAHAFHQSSTILRSYARRRLLYDSSLEMIGCEEPRAFRHWLGFVRFPVYWEDDVQAELGGLWTVPDRDYSRTDLTYVFDFHPIHVFLNTDTPARYANAKADYHAPERLRRWVNRQLPGPRDALCSLLANESLRDAFTTLSQAPELGEAAAPRAAALPAAT